MENYVVGEKNVMIHCEVLEVFPRKVLDQHVFLTVRVMFASGFQTKIKDLFDLCGSTANPTIVKEEFDLS